MILAIKMLMSKAWMWILFAVTTTLGTAVLVFRAIAGRAQKKEAEAKAALKVKEQQVEGFEHAFKARDRAAQAAEDTAKAEEERRAKREPDVKGRMDFEREPWKR